MKPTDAELIRAAFKARSFAYTPYSHFKVGAALLAKNGMVYTGCNIENAGYTPTNCAERTALFKAVSEGVTEFTDIAIVGSLDGKKNTLVTGPCGVCRQALYEFCGPRLRVLMTTSKRPWATCCPTALARPILKSSRGPIKAAHLPQ